MLNEGVISLYTILKERMMKLGYEFYFQDYKLNIIGIRSSSDTIFINEFNDNLYCAYLADHKLYCQQWKITTDPGLYWLNNPSRIEGTAILCPGQYVGVYSIDLHKGKYKALCQRNGPVKVFRDADKDDILDMDTKTIQKGYFGINIHRAKAHWFSLKIGKFSAGCQVFAGYRDFMEFMELAEIHRKLHGNKFTYTLLEEM